MKLMNINYFKIFDLFQENFKRFKYKNELLPLLHVPKDLNSNIQNYLQLFEIYSRKK